MKKEKSQKIKMIFISVVTLFTFLSDIYIIINMPKDYSILIVASVATLIFTILTLCSWINYREEINMYWDEQYINLTKLEKSSYMGIQKKFQNMDSKLNFVGQKIMPLEKTSNINQKNISSMLENLMEGQKKIAKITVGRSKENTEALMNSNDRLLLRIDKFQETIESLKEGILSKEIENYQQDFQEIKENITELKEKIQIIENLVKEENQAISENMAYREKEEQIAKAEKNKSEKNAVNDEISTGNLPALLSEAETMLEEPTEVETVIGEPIINEKETIIEEPVIEKTEEQILEESVIEEIIEETKLEEEKTKDEMSLEDMTALLSEAEMMLEDTGVEETEIMLESPVIEEESDTIIVDEPVQEESDTIIVDEPVQEESDTIIVDEPVQEESDTIIVDEPIQEESDTIIVDEPVQEESDTIIVDEPVQKESKAKNTLEMMRPEDIASLISNVMSEELPEKSVKIEKEEKPPMPDTSDTNKQMSPEDIAALIANM